MKTPQIIWDIGTAYDFFVSLHTLYNPSQFGLRGAWAAGVRSRLPVPEREFLQDVLEFIGWPADWVYGLPEPKNAQTVLDALAALPAKERLAAITVNAADDSRVSTLLRNIAARKSWTKKDEAELLAIYASHEPKPRKKKKKSKKKDLSSYLDWWARGEEFGELYLSALQTYYEVFFAEDEIRIEPALHQAVAYAQKLAQKLSVPDLLEAISYGVQFEEPPQVERLVLVPCFWSSPLLLWGRQSEAQLLLLFGARPSNASMVPGDVVPDALFQALKALADPTRLRILRYLMTEPLTPAELSRRLRLRAPTVVHHLHALRLARLVYLTISHEGRRYQARPDAVQETYAMLNAFLDLDTEPEKHISDRRPFSLLDIPF